MCAVREEQNMQVISVNVSEKKGTVKHPVPEIRIDRNGVVNDAHAGPWARQVSLLSQEIIAGFAAEVGRKVAPGEFAENITTQGVDLRKVAVLDRISVGGAELEVTQIGKKCHGKECAIFKEVGKCVMPAEGVFCRVISPGTVKAGDSIKVNERPLRIKVITLSDRASRGEYEDKSGPKIKELLDKFFAGKRWHLKLESIVIPDDSARLKSELVSARDNGADVIFTTGGTGVGPRDITPEVVVSLADKLIPGIMEHIRAKFGQNNPNALLSRSVAAVIGQTVVYALPGSVKSVEEYMPEILKTIEHLLFMLHGLDTHQ
jgi:molybdopterin adenylyltransferase